MKKETKEKLFLAGGVALAFATGITLEYVKVPVTTQEVIVETIPVYLSSQENINGEIVFNYHVPEGYSLNYDEAGNPYAYKEKPVEKKEEISLGDYIFKKKRVF